MNSVLATDRPRLSAAAWVVAGACLATALDLAFAAIYWELQGSSGARVMQAIAAYWGWGRAAYAGGAATVALGMGLFLARMLLLAALYYAAARRYRALVRRPYLCGALFGLAVYLSNAYLVQPLIGSMPHAPASANWMWTCACVLAHMGLIGVPLALAARIALAEDDAEHARR